MANNSAWHHLYKRARWKRIRLAQLSIEPLCRMCLITEEVTEATICDHITPHKGDLDLFYNGPFQSLCKHHHDSAKQAIDRGSKVVTYGIDGYPIELH